MILFGEYLPAPSGQVFIEELRPLLHPVWREGQIINGDIHLRTDIVDNKYRPGETREIKVTRPAANFPVAGNPRLITVKGNQVVIVLMINNLVDERRIIDIMADFYEVWREGHD